MHCPFYLAIAIYINPGGKHTHTETLELDESETDIDSLESIVAAFNKKGFDHDRVPSRLLLIAHSLEGGPKVIQEWG